MPTPAFRRRAVFAATALVAALVPAGGASSATGPKPVAQTGGTTGVVAHFATLHGTVNPDGQATTYHFEYGTTKSYGARTNPGSAGSGTKGVKVSAVVSGLAASTTYHYRLVAANASGTAFGGDKTFKTQPAPTAVTIGAPHTTVVFGGATTIAGQVTGQGAGGAPVTLEQSPSPAGPFTKAATAKAGPAGFYSFTGIVPGANTYYRATAKGGTSATLLVSVRFRVSLRARHRHLRRGQAIRFRGRAAPGHTGLVVLIQRRVSRHRYRTVARTRLLPIAGSTSSGFSRRIRARHSAVYRAVVGPDAGHLPGFSRGVRIHVRR